MTLLQPTIFDDALHGPPVQSLVAPQSLWDDLQGWWVQLADRQPARAPDTQTQIRDVRRWTNWSIRATAQRLGTTHTTLRAMEQGRPLILARSGDLRRRLYDLHDLIARIRVLVDQDAQRTSAALQAPDSHGRTALYYIAERDPARAYLAALDAARPRQRGSGLLVGSRPATPGSASSPLTD